MKKEPTALESLLAERLRRSGVGFIQQAIVYSYIADFLIDGTKTIIEADGPIHATEEQKKYDVQRDDFLAKKGYSIHRFTTDEIANPFMCLAKIKGVLHV